MSIICEFNRYKVEISDHRLTIGKISKKYADFALKARREVENTIKSQIKSYELFINDAGQIGYSFIKKHFVDAIIDLQQSGVHAINEETFNEGFAEASEYFSLMYKFYSQFIIDESQFNSVPRPYLFGGGFGIGGAVKGIIGAAVANVAIETGATFLENAMATGKAQNIKTKFEKMLQNGDLAKEYANIVGVGILSISHIILMIQKESGVLDISHNPSDEAIQKATKIVDLLNKEKLSQEEECKAIYDAIRLNPFERRIYKYCKGKEWSTQILEIEKYFVPVEDPADEIPDVELKSFGYTELLKILKQLKVEGVLVGNEITEKKKYNIQKTFPLDKSIKIAGLIDATILNSAKAGLIFLKDGIKWKNGWANSFDSKDNKTELSWKELVAVRNNIKIENNAIVFGRSAVFGMSTSSMAASDCLKFFKKFISAITLVQKHSAEENGYEPQSEVKSEAKKTVEIQDVQALGLEDKITTVLKHNYSYWVSEDGKNIFEKDVEYFLRSTRDHAQKMLDSGIKYPKNITNVMDIDLDYVIEQRMDRLTWQKDPADIKITYSELISCMMCKGDINKAKEYVNVLESADSAFYLDQGNIANYYCSIGDFPKAVYYAEKMLNQLHQMNITAKHLGESGFSARTSEMYNYYYSLMQTGRYSFLGIEKVYIELGEKNISLDSPLTKEDENKLSFDGPNVLTQFLFLEGVCEFKQGHKEKAYKKFLQAAEYSKNPFLLDIVESFKKAHILTDEQIKKATVDTQNLSEKRAVGIKEEDYPYFIGLIAFLGFYSGDDLNAHTENVIADILDSYGYNNKVKIEKIIKGFIDQDRSTEKVFEAFISKCTDKKIITDVIGICSEILCRKYPAKIPDQVSKFLNSLNAFYHIKVEDPINFKMFCNAKYGTGYLNEGYFSSSEFLEDEIDYVILFLLATSHEISEASGLITVPFGTTINKYFDNLSILMENNFDLKNYDIKRRAKKYLRDIEAQELTTYDIYKLVNDKNEKKVLNIMAGTLCVEYVFANLKSFMVSRDTDRILELISDIFDAAAVPEKFACEIRKALLHKYMNN